MNEINHERETKLIEENMGLVISIAKQFKPSCRAEMDEYVQAGSLGLLKAIRKLDLSKASLSTWAYKHIRWEIIRHIDSFPKNIKTVPLNESVGYSTTVDVLAECIPDYLTEEEQEVLMLRRAGYVMKDICDIVGKNAYIVGKLFKTAVDKIRLANE
jgi:RNA polymerase sigma factor (sigma-70 family)